MGAAIRRKTAMASAARMMRATRREHARQTTRQLVEGGDGIGDSRLPRVRALISVVLI